MRLFDFTHAIVRAPGSSVVGGIRSNPESEPDLEGIRAEHRAYVAALGLAGLKVEILPALEEFPDSVFVEDPALVFPEGAVLLNPGAPSRRGERDAMRGVLQSRFDRVLELRGDEFADGGDVLATPGLVFIGLSGRTTLAGARSLSAKLDALGRAARIIETPRGVLHLKTAVALLAEDTVVVTEPMARSGIFADLRVIPVPPGEDAAANLLRLNGSVLVGDCFPRTVDLVGREGLAVRPLPVREIGKLDAGLSCMSLRW